MFSKIPSANRQLKANIRSIFPLKKLSHHTRAIACWRNTILCTVLFYPVMYQAQIQKSSLDSLRKALSAARHDTIRINTLRQLAFQLSALQPDSAIRYTKKAAALSQHIGYQKGIAHTSTDLGLYYASRYDYRRADSFYDKAFAVYSELEDEHGKATVFANRSSLYNAKGDYAGALEQAFAALKILEDRNDVNTKVLVLENAGTTYLRQKKYGKTIEFYALAFEQYKKAGNRAGMARNLGNQGIVLNEQGKFAEALENHKQAYKINQELGNLYSQQINLANLGITYYNLKNFKAALSHHLKALDISRQLQNKGSIAINLGNTGELYYTIAQNSRGNPASTSHLDSAISYLSKAVELSRQISYTGPYLEFSKYLSDAFVLSGDHAKAFTVFKAAAAVEDSADTQESRLRIADLEQKRQIDIKDRDIKLKTLKLDLEKLEAKNNRNERLIYFFCIALLLSLLAWLYRQLRLRSMRHKAVLSDIARIQSHEVRAPLARILGLIFLIKKEHLDRENNEIVAFLQQSADELDEVIKKTVKKADA